MAKTFKGLIIIVSLAVLIYVVSSGDPLVAEDGEHEGGGKYAGATVSVEASLVAVELEVLEEITGEGGIINLGAVSLEKIKQCVREDGGEVVCTVKLAVRNETSGEMSREGREEEERKVSGNGVSEHEEGENRVSFRIVPTIIDLDRISVSFNFKHFASGRGLSSAQEVEEHTGRGLEVEVSSDVVLRPGQARIVGAARKDEAMFLIMDVDI